MEKEEVSLIYISSNGGLCIEKYKYKSKNDSKFFKNRISELKKENKYMEVWIK